MKPNHEYTTEKLSTIIAEMAKNGITRSMDQSKVLMRDYGIKVAPHALAEYKSHARREASGE